VWPAHLPAAPQSEAGVRQPNEGENGSHALPETAP
jgi:hypothetical protein